MPQNRSNSQPRLVVFGDDWGRHPSTIQHYIRGLLSYYEVDWINTIGTRRPRLTLADLWRGLEKIRSWIALHQSVALQAAGVIRIHSPIHWPSFHRGWERKLNRAMLLHSLREVLERPPTPTAVITTTAITADLVRAHPHLNWVYFCQDDFPAWPDLDSNTLLSMENEFLPFMRAIVVVSDQLQTRFQRIGYGSSILTAGVDLRMWSNVRRKPPPPPGMRPVATFWGSADPRLDVAICEAIAAECELVIVGPRGRVSPRLLHNPSVHWRGAVPYSQLPLIACQTDVLVMPYASTPATLAMQPLKMKEYLATGLPVVATPLPATQPWANAMDIIADPVEFAACVVRRARAPLPASQKLAREQLRDEGWEAKSQQLERILVGSAAASHSAPTEKPS